MGDGRTTSVFDTCHTAHEPKALSVCFNMIGAYLFQSNGPCLASFAGSAKGLEGGGINLEISTSCGFTRISDDVLPAGFLVYDSHKKQKKGSRAHNR